MEDHGVQGIQAAIGAREELRVLLPDHEIPLGAMYYAHATDELVEGDPLDTETRSFAVANWAKNVTPIIKDSDVFWVSADMTRLINTAAADMQRQIDEEEFRPEPLMPRMMLTDCGFAYFDQEVVVTGLDPLWTTRSYSIAFRAIGWTQMQMDGRAGLSITLFADLAQDTSSEAMRQALAANGIHMPSVVPLSTFFWGWGTAYDSQPEKVAPEVAMWLLAFYSICQQERVATRVHAQASRHVRRRWERENREAPKVSIITLRRPKQPKDNDVSVGEHRYSHRFLVHGHWRNQACGPKLRERKLIFIHPYIKGDDDLPFLEKTRIFKVVK